MSRFVSTFKYFKATNLYSAFVVGQKSINRWKTLGAYFRKPAGCVLISSPFTLASVTVSPVEEKSRETDKISESITLADKLFNENSYKELYDLLIQFKDVENAEILWRLARAAHKLSYSASSAAEEKNLHYEGYGYLQRALKLDPDNYAVHKWLFVLIDAKASHEGLKVRITESLNIKKHIARACELNPKDPTSFHFLGFWCFEIAGLPWYQRTIASTLFATPPTSSYEEALNYFLQAEEIDPNFYSVNLLMIGRTYLCLNDKEKARLYLTRARDYPVITSEDAEAIKTADKLLKSL